MSAKSSRPLASPAGGRRGGALTPSATCLYMTGLAVAVITCTTIIATDTRIIDSIQEALVREPERMVVVMVQLAFVILDQYRALQLVAAAAFASVMLWALARVYRSVRRVVADSVTRRQLRRAGVIEHAAGFDHEQNAQTSTQYASLVELFLFVTLDYVTDFINVVTMAIIIMQGLASNWTKQHQNALMYISFWVISVLGKAIAYRNQKAADSRVNDVTYLAAPVGTRVEYTSDTQCVGLKPVASSHLGLGNIVVVRPGQQVPINGFVLPPLHRTRVPASAAPFSYSITGENTILSPPLQALDVPFSEIRSVSCVRVLPPHLQSAATDGGDSHARALPSVTPSLSASHAGASTAGASPSHRRPPTPSASRTTSPRPVRRARRGLDAAPLLASSSYVLTAANSEAGTDKTASATLASVCARESISSRVARAVHWSKEHLQLAPPPETLPTAAAEDVDAAADDGGEYFYIINGERVLDTRVFEPITRGVVHAPAACADGGGSSGLRADLPPLFILAGLPRRLETVSSTACAPHESAWAWTVRRVMTIQLAVLIFFSFQGWTAGVTMAHDTVNLSTFIAYLCGQLIMGNTLLPLREKLVNVMYLGAVMSLYPRVAVKASAVLDTAREVKNIVSDKTGTLTIDSMMYAWPQRCPQWRDVHRLGPLLLLTTNDSRPNPQYCREAHEQQVHGHVGTHIAVPPHVDARLALCPTLCTTSEEGAIYHSLSQSPAERAKWQACSSGGSDIGSPTPTTLTPRPDASDTLPRGAAAMVSNECSPATLPPPATSVGVQSDEHFHYVVEYESGREARSTVPPVNILAVHASGSVRAVEHVRVLWHYLGGFEPEHVARFSLVSMWRRPAQLGECVWSDVHVRASACDAHLAALGWQRIGTAFLIAQGGGDVVARMCGDAAAAWEAEELRKNPDRTLSHALAELPNLMQVQNDAAQPLRLERGQVLDMHESLKAAGAYTLAYLSKFGNPLAANVSQLFPTLQRKGVRLHVCTGDTYLTLQAVLRDMHALPSTSIHRVPGGDAIVLHDSLPFAEVLWDDRMVPRLEAHFAAAMPVSDGQSEWHVVVASIRRRLQSPSAAGGAHASVVAHAASPLEQVLMVANAGAQVVIFASSRALEALAAHRDDMQLNAVLSHPNIVFAFYRIKQDRKPLAVALFQGIDEVEPLFIGDGPNDADALSATPHSVAIAHGSSTAKAAANVEVQTSACLPDLINMAQLFHGGRAIILRDIVFTGTYIVVMLSLAAHMNNFSSGGTKIKYFEDPWSTAFMTLFTAVVHTPRMLVTALTEGRHTAWHDHRDIAFKTTGEMALAAVAALWVGLHLRDGIAGETPAAQTALFGPLALASLATVSILRQNIVVSHKLFSIPRFKLGALFLRSEPLPWQYDSRHAMDAHNRVERATTAAGASAHPRAAGTTLMERIAASLPHIVWLMNTLPVQLLVLSMYLAAVSIRDFTTVESVRAVASALAGPTIIMLVLRGFLELIAWTDAHQRAMSEAAAAGAALPAADAAARATPARRVHVPAA